MTCGHIQSGGCVATQRNSATRNVDPSHLYYTGACHKFSRASGHAKHAYKYTTGESGELAASLAGQSQWTSKGVSCF